MAPASSSKKPPHYENPAVPEGINVSDEHPLKEFLLLALGALAALALFIAVLAWSAEYLARYIPFRLEQALASKFSTHMTAAGKPAAGDSLDVQRYLDDLATRIAAAQELPQDMSVSIHLVDGDAINAFATLGGHIFILRGLLERLPNENALAMVVAHEIAHVKHRDPIVALGRGVTIAVAFAALVGLTDSDLLQGVLNRAGEITVLKFSRDQEEAADDAALKALQGMYGHVAGAEALFELLPRESGSEAPVLFSTHPLSADRVAKIAALARDDRAFDLTPLPPFVPRQE